MSEVDRVKYGWVSVSYGLNQCGVKSLCAKMEWGQG